MLEPLQKIFSALRNSISGLSRAYKQERSVRWEVWIGSIVFAIVLYVSYPFSAIDVLILALAFALVLITELLNTSLEYVMNRLHPRHDDIIGAAKDIGSAAVFIAILFAVLAIGIVIAR